MEYLLGNHTIAETMFRHDPKALLYAPLRLLIYADADGNAVFSMDQPSAAFGSLGIAEVTKVGESLDRKVANLLRLIGVDADRGFRGLRRRNPAGPTSPAGSIFRRELLGDLDLLRLSSAHTRR